MAMLLAEMYKTESTEPTQSPPPFWVVGFGSNPRPNPADR